MSFGYTRIDGERVEAHVAADFARLKAAFEAAFPGLTLYVSSGVRTREEQAYLYNGWINRLPGFNLAAPPGYSNHEETGPIGPRALDIRDSGADYGVTSRGTVRDTWMAHNAERYRFRNAGYNFDPVEAWHKEWMGNFAGLPSDGGSGIPISQEVQNQQNWLNASRGERLEPDGRKGELTTAAFKRYQEHLRAYGYTGDIDGEWGPGTQAAHALYYAEWQLAHQPTPGIPAFPLPAGYYFGPEAGGEYSISGWHSYTADLKAWQARMAERGWQITVDGLYGPVGAVTPTGNTYDIALAFQKEKGLSPDGLIGPETWKAAWTSPVTPPVTTPPVVPPVTPEVPVTPPVPGTGYVPTQVENPRGLPVVPKTYPGAKFALQAPLGDGPRGTKGSNPAVPVETVVDRAIEHWTGVDALQYDWFSYKNSRSSCPTWYILPNGDVVEFIPFEAKPALTGAEWNWRSVGWEIQKTPDSQGTPEQFEAVCQILAWLASMNGQSYRGVPVRFTLDREHFVNHREVIPGTECPGEWWNARMDAQLIRARAILAEKYGTPTTPVDPDPPVESGKINVDRAAIEEIHEVATELVNWTTEVLG